MVALSQTSSAIAHVVTLSFVLATSTSASRHLLSFKDHENEHELVKPLEGASKAELGSNASKHMPMPLERTPLNMSHHSSAHSALLQVSDNCKCVFKGSCSCQAALEFMSCITAACDSGMCACGSGDHFAQACSNVASVCPDVGLKCESEQAQCAGDHVPFQTADGAQTPASAPLKSVEVPLPLKDVEVPQAQIPEVPSSLFSRLMTNTFSIMHKLFAFVGHVILMLILAALYDKYRHRELAFSQPKSLDAWDAPGFKYHLFGCFADWRTSLVTCCCWQLRWADTIDKANLGRFWTMVIIFIILSSFYDVHMGGLSFLILVVVATHYRQQLRRVFQAKVGGTTILGDFCVYFWCGCCAIIQEARQVESC